MCLQSGVLLAERVQVCQTVGRQCYAGSAATLELSGMTECVMHICRVCRSRAQHIYFTMSCMLCMLIVLSKQYVVILRIAPVTSCCKQQAASMARPVINCARSNLIVLGKPAPYCWLNRGAGRRCSSMHICVPFAEVRSLKVRFLKMLTRPGNRIRCRH